MNSILYCATNLLLNVIMLKAPETRIIGEIKDMDDRSINNQDIMEAMLEGGDKI